MAKEVKIEVVEVRDVKLDNGRTFKAYKTIPTGGKYKGEKIDLKFVQGAENVPQERCFIYVDSDQYNLSERGRFPVYWIKTVKRIEPLKARTKADDDFTAADEESAESPF